MTSAPRARCPAIAMSAQPAGLEVADHAGCAVDLAQNGPGALKKRRSSGPQGHDTGGTVERTSKNEVVCHGMPSSRVILEEGDIGAAIEELAFQAGCSVVRAFGGHGIGRTMHTAPHVNHFGVRGTGLRLKAGMAITIEPMINLGRPEVRISEAGWTCRDRRRPTVGPVRADPVRHQDRLRDHDRPRDGTRATDCALNRNGRTKGKRQKTLRLSAFHASLRWT